jgi:hypothetical protein
VIETIVFVGAVLCMQVGQDMVCQNINPKDQIGTVFAKTVTDWQKIPSETTYNIEKEVKIEQRNIRP